MSNLSLALVFMLGVALAIVAMYMMVTGNHFLVFW
jgi:hypothetical protein